MTQLLVVEDHEENRTLLKILLEANGYRVTAAGDGLEALAAARRDRPDAIISDVLMPKMDGFALCRAWMQDAGLKAIPFVFYSATYVQPADEKFAAALGAVRYLIKPLEAEVFLRELRAVLQQWAGHAAPGPASPLDDAAAHDLHKSALARKLEDKVAQLEAANRKLQESEARFRSLTEMSSDFFWESDAEHRLKPWISADERSSAASAFVRDAQVGKRRWETPHLSPDEAGWQAHRAMLDAHQPFREFEVSRRGADGNEYFVSISGDPVYKASGAFEGYRGVGKDITDRVRRISDLRRFRAAMDATADAIYLVDRTSMRFIDVNEAACGMQGRTREELLALGPEGVLSVPREELERTYDSIIAGGAGAEPVEMLRRRKDGTQVWVELRRRARRSGAGWMIVTTVRDITERKHAEQALRESAENLRLFTDNVPAMTASFDENLHLVFVNKRYADFFGYGAADILGKHLREIIGEGEFREIEGHFVQVLQGQPVAYRRTRKLRHGDSRYLEIKLLPHIGDQGKVLGCFAVVADITEHILAEERIQRLAHHDSLTGLPNRLLFSDRLGQVMSLAKRNSRQFAVLYLDLDKFKPVNDALGHTAGDELLKSVAARIQGQLRDSDTVARVGGDEFAVILPDIARRDAAETVAKKIVAIVAAPFLLGSQKRSVEIGISIGVAIYPEDARDADALVKAADAAMYSAKQVGGCFRFCVT